MKPQQAIILVDDNVAHRTLVKRAMKKAGIGLEILEASGLDEARKLLFGKAPLDVEPVVAIVDLNLGDGRGTSLIKDLRASEQMKRIPILVLSTSNLESDMLDSYHSGADCYLTKSNDPTVFSIEISSGVAFCLRQR